MLQNKFSLILIFVFNFIFSQQKVDTVYVYEEVIVHDTIYIDKPISELKFDNVVFTKDEFNKGKLQLTQNGKKIEIKVDSTNIVFPKSKTRNKSWFFGGKFHFGMASNSLFEELNSPNTIGFGLGIWTKKQLFNSKFSIGIGLDGLYWSSPFLFDASQNNSSLNGYYFTNSNQPILFKGIENKHFQFQIPLQIYYKYRKFIPSIGVFASISNYKSEFIGSSGKIPISLDETQVFEAQALQMGYLAELQYEISKHISVGLNFSSGTAKNLIFINQNDKNQMFKTQNAFKENRLLAQLIYKL
jgi:hypothetical protein